MSKSGATLDGLKKIAGFPARFYLAILVLAVAAPTILVTGYALMRYAEAERTRLEEQIRDNARMIASALDRRFAGLIEAVQVLALTHEFDQEGMEELHARAARARGILGRNVVLRDLEGRQLVNPRVAWGVPLPRTLRPLDKRAIETGRPVVSGVFESPLDGTRIVSIVAPVMREGKPIYLLNLSQELSYFENLLTDVRMPAQHLGLIMDAEGVVIARSRDSQKFAGGKGVSIGAQREGATIAANLDGHESLTGWATSEISGWRATASVRHEISDAPRRQALIAIALIGASAIGLGLVLAWAVGARISRSLRSLTRASAALGARTPVPEVRTPLSEVNEVGRELRNAENRLAENEARLEKALVAARMYSFAYSGDSPGIIRSASASVVLGEIGSLRNGAKGQLRERIHPLDRERFIRSVDARNPDAPEYSVEFRYIRPDGEILWLHVNGVCEREPLTNGVRVSGFVRDVTSRKESEIRQSLLVRELHHRVKNNLATVLALANLSGRNATSVADYQNKLRARIQSMARSHSLLNENSFRPGFLRTLLHDELEPYAQGELDRIHLEGPDVDLPPEAALALGMAAHELATNAGKYGALSSEHGQIDVRWQVIESPGAEHDRCRLRLEWRESGGPPVTPPAHKGFGSRLLENVIGEQLKGWVELRYEPAGLVAIIEAQLDPAHGHGETDVATSA